MPDSNALNHDNEFRKILLDRMAQATERLKSIEAETVRWKRHIETLRAALANLPSAEGAQSHLMLIPDNKRSFGRMTVQNACRTVLETHGHPMAVKDLLEILRAGGKVVGGKKPTDTLRAMLRYYDETFVRLDNGKWTIKPDEVAPDFSDISLEGIGPVQR